MNFHESHVNMGYLAGKGGGGAEVCHHTYIPETILQ